MLGAAGDAARRCGARRRPRARGLGVTARPRGGRVLRLRGFRPPRPRARGPEPVLSRRLRAPRPRLGLLPRLPAAMAAAARERAGWGRRLLLLCLWLPSARAAVQPSAPLSGVEQLLDLRRQLQQERPQEELPLELRASGGPQQGCPGPGGGDYSAMPDAVIRIKDSIAAGASFLRAPTAVRDSRECVAACCAEPRCSVAVVELPRRPATTDTALGCYLFNCTARGRSVCKFAMRRGYSSYSLSRAWEGGQQGLEAGLPSTAWASPRLGKRATEGGWDTPLGSCCPCCCWVASSARPCLGRTAGPSSAKSEMKHLCSKLS